MPNQIVALLAHLWGDYILQSDWMALNKSKRSWPCLVHVLLYTACFLFVTTSWKALSVIGVTHFLIDRFGLARYLCWAKNHMAPGIQWNPALPSPEIEDPEPGYYESVPLYASWAKCSVTGYDDSRPIWLTVWLLIAADNTLHLTINYIALRYLS